MSTVDIIVNSDDIDIKLSGSSVAKIASVFIPYLKKTVIPTLLKTVEKEVKTIVNDQIDTDLQEYGSQATIPYLAGVTFDYGQLNEGPVVSADPALLISFNGTFFDSENLKASGYSPVAVDQRDASGKKFQAFLTDYTLNTLFEAGYLTGNTLDITYLLSKFLKVDITVKDIAVLIPEMLETYDKASVVGITATFSQAPSEVIFSTEGGQLQGNGIVSITVGDEVAISAEFKDLSIVGIITPSSGSIFGEISEATIGSIGAFETSLGLEAEDFATEFQTNLKVYIDEVNALLAAGIAIPTVFSVDFSDISLEFNDGYVKFCLSAAESLYNAMATEFMVLRREAQDFNAIQPIQ